VLTNTHLVFIADNSMGMSKRAILAQLRAWADGPEPMDVSNDDSPLEDATMEDVAMEMEDATMEDVAMEMEDATMEDATMEDIAMEDATMDDATMDDIAMEDIAIEDVPIQALKTMTYISRKRSRDENVTMVPTSSPRSRSKRYRPSNMEQWTTLGNICKNMGALTLA